MTVFAKVASTLIVILAVLAYPWVHNYYLHPLGQLQARFDIDDECSEAVAAFESYAKSRSGSPDTQYVRDVTELNFFRTESVPPSTLLFIYDLSIFDDLQLYIRCSNDREDGVIVEKVFIGD